MGWREQGISRGCGIVMGNSVKLVGLSHALSTKRGSLGYLDCEGPMDNDDGSSLST